METPHLRPTFVVPLRPPRDEAIAHIRARLNETVPDRWIGKGRWAEIHVPGDERRIWSPYLSLRLDHREGGHHGFGHLGSGHAHSGDQRAQGHGHSPDDAGAAEVGCTLFARFAPRPEIWTGIVFLYAAIAFVAVLGGIFGYVQWASGESAWGLWAIWLGLPALGGIHLIGMIGRRLSRDQMLELRARMEPAIAEIRVDLPSPGGEA